MLIVTKCNDNLFFLYLVFLEYDNLFMGYVLINHLAILETRNIPNAATVVPTIKVVPFLFQKSLPS